MFQFLPKPEPIVRVTSSSTDRSWLFQLRLYLCFLCQALGMTSSQDRAMVKKKLKEMKMSLEKARKAQEKMEKQREKLRRKEQEQMQRKSRKTEKLASTAVEGAGEQ